MRYELTTDDIQFRSDFEACRMAPADFDHRAHVRLGYVYLAEHDDATALTLMREALQGFLEHHRIDVSKYHETMTHAWLLAVRHFMETSSGARSADHFIETNPALLDSKIMLSHYSAGVLFSGEARADFVEPDPSRYPEASIAHAESRTVS